MKNLLFFLISCVLVITLQAQKVYFVYFQSDAGKSFHVKLNDKIYNSSSAGYLIVPNLIENTYQVNIGSHGGKIPEAAFSFTIHNSDKGFLLKELEEEIGLIDLQTSAVIKPTTTETANRLVEKKDDPFSRLLSKAADDTTILTSQIRKPETTKIKNPQPKKEEATIIAETKAEIVEEKTEEKPAQIQSELKPEARPDERKNKLNQQTVTNSKVQLTDSEETSTIKDSVSTENLKPELTSPIKNENQITSKENNQSFQPYKRSIVTHWAESSTTEGFGLVFLDNADGVVDTIRILISNSNRSFRTSDLEQNTSYKESSNLPASEAANPQSSPIPSGIKSNCSSVASEEDFRKLRRSMVGEDNDQAMIEEARKVFKIQCFTTEQIRHLSSLFITEESKYRFFDAAYRHVSDAENFLSLQLEFKDQYYLKRFKALLGE